MNPANTSSSEKQASRFRIGLDLTLLQPDRVTGVERYAQNLALALLEQPARDIDWIFFFRFGVPAAFQRFADRCSFRISPFTSRPMTDQIWLPWAARQARLDLLHALAYPVSPAYRGRFVLTVHDAALWRYPEHLSRGGRLYYKPLFPQAIRRATRIVTVSKFSQSELCEIFQLDPNLVTPILEGLDPAFDQPPPRVEAEAPFLLTVGTIEPRKNLIRLLEARSLLPPRHADVPLLIVGRQGWQDPASLPEAARHPSVRWLGQVEDAHLKQLYRTATVFAFPSLYEGFGLPLLEALSQGAPTLASQAGSLPEVGAESCLYADPQDADDWAKKLTRLLDQLQLRQDLSERGLARSRLFRWESTARQTLDLYKQALQQPQTVRILDANVQRVDLAQAESRILALLESRQGGLVVTPNVDHLMSLRRDPLFRTIYQSATLVLADGMPLVWASWLLGRPLPQRVAGSDLLPPLCHSASRRGFRVFFLGGQPETLPALLERIQSHFPQLQLVGAHSPPFGFENDPALDQQALQAILEAKPDLLLIGLGAPKQEKFYWRHRAQLSGILAMGIGMGMEFLAGQKSRAPVWMRKSGLEWLHRLFQEPGRLWRRYLRDAAFPCLILGQLLREGRQKRLR